MDEVEASVVLPHQSVVIKVIGAVTVRKSQLFTSSSSSSSEIASATSTGNNNSASVDDDDDDDDGTDMTVSVFAILTDYSIILVSSLMGDGDNEGGLGESNKPLRSYSIAERASSKAVDAVYVPSLSSFVLAKSDNRIVIVPLTCGADTSVCSETLFPSAIRKLYHFPDVSSSNLLVCCDNGNSFITSSPELPLDKESQANNNTGITYVDSCSNSHSIYMVVSSAAAKSLSSTISNKVIAINIKSAIENISGGNNALARKWVPIRHSAWKDGHTLTLDPLEKIVSLVSHEDSYSIILERDLSDNSNSNNSNSNSMSSSADASKKKRKSSEGKSSGSGGSNDASTSSASASTTRWIKFDSHSNVLFERNLGLRSIFSVRFLPQSRCIWIASGSNDSGVIVTAWSLMYGTSSTNSSFQLKADSLGVGSRSQNRCGEFVSSNGGGSLSLVLARASGGNGASLYRLDLEVGNSQKLGSLLLAIGGNNKIGGSAPSSSSSSSSNSNIYIAAKRCKVDSTIDLIEFESRGEEGTIIASLREKIFGADMAKYFDSIENKANLVEMRENSEFFQFFSGSSAGLFRSNPGNVSADQRLYFETDLVATDTFLELVKEVSVSVDTASQLTSREWNILKALLRAGLVNSSKCPMLFDMICSQKRLDLLHYMAQYLPDLSEKTALQMLLFAGSIEESDLSSYAVVDGKLALYTSNKASVPAEKSKKVNKKSKKDSNDMSVDGNTGDSNIVDGHVVSFLTPLSLLRTICEAFLHRKHAYSKILLSDVIRRCLSSKIALLVLRVFMEIILDQSSPRTSATTTNISFLGDLHMQNACSWIEAIIDAHFVSTSLQIRSHLATRQAFVAFFDTILTSAEASAAGTEELAGIWNHVLRLQKCPVSTSEGPPQGLYRKEILKFS